MRRKGEKPVVHEPLIWSQTCTVANAIKSGDRWFYAWAMQQCVRSFRKTGIASERILALDHGAIPTEEELSALAITFRTDVQSLASSIEFERSLKEETGHGS